MKLTIFGMLNWDNAFVCGSILSWLQAYKHGSISIQTTGSSLSRIDTWSCWSSVQRSLMRWTFELFQIWHPKGILSQNIEKKTKHWVFEINIIICLFIIIFFCHQKLNWYVVVDNFDLYQQIINTNVKKGSKKYNFYCLSLLCSEDLHVWYRKCVDQNKHEKYRYYSLKQHDKIHKISNTAYQTFY